MRFWWVSDCNCSAPLRAYACCRVRTQRSRYRLAGYIGTKFGCCQTKKAAQKWQNNENANVKVSQKDLIERALAERLIQQSGTVQPIRKMEM